MEIRYITETDDRKAISRIYEESWKHAYSGILSQEYLDSIPKGKWADKIDTPGWHTLVCIENGNFIGTGSFCKSRFKKYSESGEIISIYFLPEYIRKGFGSTLLVNMLYKLKKNGFKEAFLWVLEDNTGARQFYENFGFACTYEYREDIIGGKNLKEVRYIYRFVEYNDYSIMGDNLRVYYLLNYIPKNKAPEMSESEYDKEIRNKLWDYKNAGNNSRSVMLEMTGILHQGLLELSSEGKLGHGERIKAYKKHLIAVPASNSAKKSSIVNSIDIICKNDNSFINRSSLLYRHTDLTPRHLGGISYSLEDLENSLGYRYDGKADMSDSVYFIIDDIVTSGNSMLSCVNTLEKNGISRYKIFCIALAKTRSLHG